MTSLALHFRGGTLVTPHHLLVGHRLTVGKEKILHLTPDTSEILSGITIDLQGGYLVPGFIDLHVHGGAGHDFMDGTEAAFRGVCQAHARHGTTRLLPTTTVASHEHHLRFLDICHRLQNQATGGARIAGAHFYGPYFAQEARGCHPGETVRPPRPEEYAEYLDFGCITRATVAPELPGAEEFVRACRNRGIGCNAGHSYATFDQMQASLAWGVSHVDHLFCAMSDRARLRQTQTFPMRGGVLEATLYFDELTTEVIADGQHLSADLLKLAFKIKGPDHLALVTDANRALDMPDGPYIFGPQDAGEPILKKDGVGLMLDGKALASGVVGMDHAVRTFWELTGTPFQEVIRMATLTPARIAGIDRDFGSLEVGKVADLVVLDAQMQIREVYIAGQLMS